MQFGFSEDTEYFGYDPDFKTFPSSWNVYPTPEEPGSKYKFVGFEISFKKDLI